MAMPAKRKNEMARRRMPPFAANGPEPRLILDYPYGLNENITDGARRVLGRRQLRSGGVPY
jgi:hypothetical protein